MSQFYEHSGSTEAPPSPSLVLVTGLLANVTSFTGVLGLMLGRWWQALLYNPGGFKQEFNGLRLNTPQALVCVLAGLYSFLQGQGYMWLAVLLQHPLLFIRLTIVHHLVD